MRVGERFGDFARDAQGVVDRQLPFAVDAFLQRLALDERHDIVEDAVDGAGIEDREDVGVGQLGGDLDFAEEAIGAEGGAHLGAHHLDRRPCGGA